VYMYVHMCTYMYMYVHMCTYVYMYVHMLRAHQLSHCTKSHKYMHTCIMHVQSGQMSKALSLRQELSVLTVKLIVTINGQFLFYFCFWGSVSPHWLDGDLRPSEGVGDLAGVWHCVGELSGV